LALRPSQSISAEREELSQPVVARSVVSERVSAFDGVADGSTCFFGIGAEADAGRDGGPAKARYGAKPMLSGTRPTTTELWWCVVLVCPSESVLLVV